MTPRICSYYEKKQKQWRGTTRKTTFPLLHRFEDRLSVYWPSAEVNLEEEKKSIARTSETKKKKKKHIAARQNLGYWIVLR